MSVDGAEEFISAGVSDAGASAVTQRGAVVGLSVVALGSASSSEADDEDDVESVKFTVGDGELEKTFEMDSPKSPLLRLVLNDNGEDHVEVEEFLQQCGGLAEETYKGLGRTFDYSWMR